MSISVADGAIEYKQPEELLRGACKIGGSQNSRSRLNRRVLIATGVLLISLQTIQNAEILEPRDSRFRTIEALDYESGAISTTRTWEPKPRGSRRTEAEEFVGCEVWILVDMPQFYDVCCPTHIVVLWRLGMLLPTPDHHLGLNPRQPGMNCKRLDEIVKELIAATSAQNCIDRLKRDVL